MPTALDLFERHHVAVFRFLRRMGLSAPDAEDLTQQVFLRVTQAVERYEERQMERSWVFRIARNVRLDDWRRRARSPEVMPLPDGGPVALAVGPLERLGLQQALARLAEPEREAFLMREVAGLGYVDIAQVTGASADAVRNRIYRARVALRQALGGLRESAPAVRGRE
jgi:RNA polymerase sigma-70 factor (ECF subfamily)